MENKKRFIEELSKVFAMCTYLEEKIAGIDYIKRDTKEDDDIVVSEYAKIRFTDSYYDDVYVIIDELTNFEIIEAIIETIKDEV